VCFLAKKGLGPLGFNLEMHGVENIKSLMNDIYKNCRTKKINLFIQESEIFWLTTLNIGLVHLELPKAKLFKSIHLHLEDLYR